LWERNQKLISGMEQALYILILSLLLAVTYNQFSPNRLSWSSGQVSPLMRNSMEITLAEARALQVNGKAVFLDARDPASFREGHITGALNINTDTAPANLELLQSLSKSGKILVAYCDGIGCPLGGELGRNLRQQGLSDVRVLEKGLSFWAEAKYPVDR
jgi:rhodanese-related sulfurtransferase